VDNLLNKDVKKDYGYQRGATLVGAILALVIGVVLIFGVAIPVADDVISSAGLTGTNETIAKVAITMMAIVPIVLVSQLI